MSQVQVTVEPEARECIQQCRNGPVYDMFEELNQLAMEEQAVCCHHRNEEIVNRVDAELLLFKREQHLPL